MQLYPKLEMFSRFFPKFLKSKTNFEHFEKKEISLIADLFPKL